jgi:ATP-binding cassette subfamily B multidrug efflux pump
VKNNKYYIKRFIPYITKYKLLIIASLVFLLVATLCSMLIPLLSKQAIDKFIQAKDIHGLLRIAVLFAITAFVLFAAKIIQIYSTNLAGQRIMKDLRHDLFKHMENLSVSYFSKEPSGKVITRITNDVENMNQLLSSGIVALLGDLALIAFAFIFIFYINFKLALIVVIPMPFAILSALLLGNKMEKLYEKVRDFVVKLNIEMQETLSGIVLVQTFGAEERQRSKFRKIATGYRETFHKAQMSAIMLRQSINILSFISISLIIIFGGTMAVHGKATIGTIVAFLSYLNSLYGPLRDLSDKFSILQNAISSMKKLSNFLDAKDIIHDPENPVYKEKIVGDVNLKNIYFSYDKKTPTLTDINLEARHGEKIAIVGFTGAGKSTIANLVLRFYDPDNGSVEIDGINIKKFKKKFIRSFMGMVLQNVFIFKGTVRENITLGREDISDEEIIKAAKEIGVHSFIKNLQNGYDTELSTEGKNISQGERQLISFTRALVYNPRILLLDEATASIDTNTEELIENGLKKLMEGRTSIVIAHRLATIKNADKIYVINRGRIVEYGTHSALMKKEGLYYELYTMQFEKI